MSGSGTTTLPEEPTTAPAAEVESAAAPPPGGAFLLQPVICDVFTRDRFSEEQREIAGMVREFAAERIAPRREELAEHSGELTMELMREVGELGLTGVDIPEKHGGMGLDKTTSALVVEALALGGSASWVVTFSCHVGIGTLPVVFFGDERQKERYLPKLASVPLRDDVTGSSSFAPVSLNGSTTPSVTRPPPAPRNVTACVALLTVCSQITPLSSITAVFSISSGTFIRYTAVCESTSNASR